MAVRGGDLLGPVNDLYIHLGQPPPPDEPFVDEAAHGLGHLLNGDAAGAVEVVEVHPAGLEPGHGVLQVPADCRVHPAPDLGPVQKELGPSTTFSRTSFKTLPTMRSLWPMPARPGL